MKTQAPSNEVAFWIQHDLSMTRIAGMSVEGAAAMTDLICKTANPIHGNCKPVRVIAVDDVVAARFIEPLGRAKPVELNQTFESAKAASLWVGLTFNDVGTKLAAARRTQRKRKNFGRNCPQPLTLSAEVRGVTFIHEEDFQSAKQVPPRELSPPLKPETKIIP